MSPFSLIVCVLWAGVLALVLLTAFPAVLMTWGPFLAWLFLSVILAWFGVDEVDAWMEEESQWPDTRKRYAIHWRSLLTGYEGHGTSLYTEDEAQEICRAVNRQHARCLFHWPAAG